MLLVRSLQGKPLSIFMSDVTAIRSPRMIEAKRRIALADLTGEPNGWNTGGKIIMTSYMKKTSPTENDHVMNHARLPCHCVQPSI